MDSNEHQNARSAIVAYCETFLEKHGDSYLGVGWTKKQEYADARYRVMLEGVRRPEGASPDAPIQLLDFGSGAAHLYEYLQRTGRSDIAYSGLDLSKKFLALSRSKHPDVTFHEVDLLAPDARLPTFDFIVLNGIFNSKLTVPYEEMWAYLEALLTRAFEHSRAGIAFNVMSKLVDWERDDLFHVPFERLTAFVWKRLSRNFVVRHDYGLFEYTVYVYR